MPSADAIDRIRGLIGSESVLIPVPKGRKSGWIRWRDLTIDDMNDHAHLQKLYRSGNVGVVMGAPSGGLISVDLDSDKLANEFLELNPPCHRTLVSKGVRGCNVWIRMKGEYPPLKKLSMDGNEVGEFRSTGGTTIIWGTHPEGTNYRFVQEHPTINLAFNDICWPGGIDYSGILYTERTESTDENRRDPENSSQSKIKQVFEPKELVKGLIPSKPHQNHRILFELARRVLRNEKDLNSLYTNIELMRVFEEWYLQSTDWLRHDQSKEEYMQEFLASYDAALFPECDDFMEYAWEKAKCDPLPSEANITESKNEQFKLLVALCYQLSRLSKNGVFFLSCRKAQKIIGLKCHAQAAQWLKLLVRLKVLAITEEANTGKLRAHRYRYESI